jgi:Ig domain of plant-specific actin-binding protein/Bacterial Ig-like domain
MWPPRWVPGLAMLIVSGILAATALTVLPASTAADGPSCTDNWTGAAGDGLWQTAGNWSTGTVPSSSDVVCIASGTTVKVTGSSHGSSLQDEGTLEISGGSLELLDSATADVSTVSGLTLTGGSLSLAGELDVSGSLATSGGVSVEGAGKLVVESGVDSAVGSGCSYLALNGATFVNEGTLTWGSSGGSSDGAIMMENGAQLLNKGTFNDDSYDPGCGYGYGGSSFDDGGAAPSIINTGIFTAETGSNIYNVEVPFANEGTVEAKTGTLQLSSGGSGKGGTWTAASAAALTFTGGSFSLSGDTWSGAGTISIAGAGVTGEGLKADDANVGLSSGALTIAGGTTSSVGGLALSGGTLSLAGELDISTGLSTSGGVTIEGPGKLVIGSGVNSSLGSGCSYLALNGATLVNHGTLTWGSSGGSTDGAIMMQNGAQLENTGTFNDDSYDPGCGYGYGGTSINDGGGTASGIENTGTFTAEAGSNTYTVQVPFSNEGKVEAKTGTLQFSGGGISERVATGAWSVQSGAEILLSAGTFLIGEAVDLSAVTIDGATIEREATSGPPKGHLDPLPFASQTVTLAGTGKSIGTGFSTATIEVTPAGKDEWQTLCSALTPALGGEFSCNWNTKSGAYPDGSYEARAQLSDSSEPPNVAPTAAITVLVDNTLPAGSLTAPEYIGAASTVTGTATDSGSGVASWQLQISPAGSTEWTDACPAQTAPTSGDTYQCTVEVSGDADGTARLQAVITDNAGNIYTTPVSESTVDNTPPTGSLAKPTEASYVRGPLALQGTASDPIAGVTSWTAQVAPAGTESWTNACPVQTTPTSGSSYGCTLETTSFSDGEYVLRAVILDNAGNSNTTATQSIKIDHTPPTGTLNGLGRYSSGTVDVKGPATDAGSGVASWQLQITPNGQSSWQNECLAQILPTEGDEYGCELDTTELADGRYQLRAVITDNAGNTYTTPSISTFIDNTVSGESTCTDTWTGDAGDGLWQTAANWSTGAVPAANDVACIGAGETVDVTAGANQVSSIEDEGALVLAGGSLSLIEAAEYSSVHALSVQGGTLTGPGSLDVSGSLSWTGGTMSGSGSTVLEPDATGTINPGSGGSVALTERTLSNHGTLTLESGSVEGRSSAELDNSGTFDANADVPGSEYSSYGLLNSDGSNVWLDNTGTVTKTAGSEYTQIQFQIENEGVVEDETGQIIFTGGSHLEETSSGSWHAREGASLAFNSGSFLLGSNVQISGMVFLSGGNIQAGDIQGDANMLLWANGSTLQLTDPLTPSHVASLEQYPSTTLTGEGALDLSTGLSWTGGTMSGSGSTILEAGATGTIDPGFSDSVALSERTLNNQGALTWSNGTVYGEDGASIDNSGTFDTNGENPSGNWFSSGLLRGGGAAPTIMNTGTLAKTAGDGVSVIQFAVQNEGIVKATGEGQLNLWGGGSGHENTGSWQAPATSPWASGIALSAGSFSLGSNVQMSGSIATTGASVEAGAIQGPNATFWLWNSNGSLDLTDGSTPSHFATLNMQPGTTLTGPGTVDVAGELSWTGGTMSGPATTRLEPGATGSIEAASGCETMSLTDRKLINEGTLTFSSGTLLLSDGARLENEGTFDDDSESSCDSGQIENWSGAASSVLNTGTFQKTTGGGTSTVAASFANQGAVEGKAGALDFSDGGIPEETAFGSWATQSGASIVLSGGTFLISEAVDLSAVEVTGATIELTPAPRPPTGSLEPHPYAAGTVTVSGSGEEHGLGFSSATIEITPAGQGEWQTLCGPLTPGLIGEFSCSWETASSSYPDGSYQLRAQLTDSQSPSEATATSPITVLVDNTPPAGSLTAPSDLSTTPTVSGTASDSGSGVASWQLQIAPEGSSEWTSACSEQTAPVSGDTYQCEVEAGTYSDGSYQLRAVITDNAGNIYITAAQDTTIENTAPSNMTPPAISGTLERGQQLSASSGTWNGTLPLTYTYQWQSCNSAGESCSSISGATSSKYELGAGDVGTTLRVAVTASNSAGSATSTSPATEAIAEPSCTDSWTGGDDGDWQDPANWSTGSVPGPSDIACVGTGITVQVTGGTNQTGALQDEGGLVISGGSLELADATITSTVTSLTLSGATLTGPGSLDISSAFSMGSYSTMSGSGETVVGPSVTGEIYASSGCEPMNLTERRLVNEGTLTYGWGTLFMDDGARFENKGTFNYNTEASCYGTQIQDPSGDGAAPSVLNTGTFTKTAGGGTSTVAVNFSNQGSVEPRTGTLDFSEGGIPGEAADGTWTVPSEGSIVLSGGTFRIGEEVDLAAVQLAGATVEREAVVGAPNGSLHPRAYATGAVTISGVGKARSSGFSSATIEVTPAGQSEWQALCGPLTPESDGEFACAWSTASGSYPDGAYELRAQLSDNSSPPNTAATAAITVLVDNTPPSGSISAPSDLSGTPKLSGTASDSGSGVASWQPQIAPEGSSEWANACPAQSAPTSGETYECEVAAGALADGAYELRAVVSDKAGNTYTTPTATTTIENTPPSSTAPPTINGAAEQGFKLTATTGAWNGTTPLTYSYQWERCDSTGAECSSISGATHAGYVPSPGDVGKTLRVGVEAGNTAGVATSVSSATATVTASSCTDSWTGEAGDGLWETPENWSTGSVPGSEDFACIAPGDPVQITQGENEVGTLEDDGALSITGGSLALTDGGSRSSVESLALNNATLTGPGTLDVSGELDLGASAAMSGSGETVIASGAVGTIEQPSGCETMRLSERTLVNEGTLTFSSGTLAMSAGARLENKGIFNDNTESSCHGPQIQREGGGIADVLKSGIRPFSVIGGGASPSILNTGTFEKTAGAGTSTVAVNFGNQGSVEARSGTLEFSDGGIPEEDAKGSWATSDGAAIVLSGGTFLIGEGVDLSDVTVEGADVTEDLAPSNTAPPSIAGQPIAGETLSATTGSWDGTQPLTYSYQWQTCNSSGEDCSGIPGAVAETYVPSIADAGSTLRVMLTATNSAGAATSVSEPTALITAAPANTLPPSISGFAGEGHTLTASTGTWEGLPAPTYTYQWQSCSSLEEGCLDIAGATSSSYSLEPSEVGDTIVVVVTATNSVGSASSASEPTAVVAGAPPSNTVVPTVMGEPVAGAALRSSTGTWEGASPFTYAYQWQSCNAEGEACKSIDEATARSYTPTAAEVGKTLRVLVTASNIAGAASETSAASAPVAAATPPSNTTPPTITGAARDGQTLTAQPGAWEGTAPVFTYKWQSCNPDGEECQEIEGADSQDYTLGAGDTETELRVQVTGTNPAGSATATSAPSEEITPGPPTELEPPSISGIPYAGEMLTADPGTWSGGETQIGYQWESCNPTGGECQAIVGAVQAQYPLGAEDIGTTLRVRIAASDEQGSVTAVSIPTAVIAATATTLVNTFAPSVSGSAQVGQRLTVDPGSWTGEDPIEYAYQWQLCDENGEECEDIAGATSTSYLLDSEDIGMTVQAVITVSDASESTSQTLAATRPVTAEGAPVVEQDPVISGSPLEGQTLVAVAGTWSSELSLSYSYQWERCEEHCSAIAGATGTSYTLGSVDVGSTVRLLMTATSAEGSSTAVSSATAVISAARLQMLSAPSITGAAETGHPLNADPGMWTASGPIAYAYQWELCGAAGEDCSSIAGASGPSFTPSAEDLGSALRVMVSATAAGEHVTLASAPTSVIVSPDTPPESTSLPSIEGDATTGDTLSALPGAWAGAEPISYSYQWQSCNEEGEECANIEGATEGSYVLDEGDVGTTIRLEQTATNSLASTSATSVQSEVIGAPGPPASSQGPTIEGIAKEGEKLFVDNGAWSGSRPLSYLYRWERCNTAGEACTAIEGADKPSYLLGAADVGQSIRVELTVSNSLGAASASSEAVSVGPAGQASASQAIEIAQQTDPSILQPSTNATVSGQSIKPALTDSGGELSSESVLNNSTISKHTPGELAINTSDGELSVEPTVTEPDAETLPTIVNGVAAVFADTAPATDTIVRPEPLGADTLLQLRSPDAPKTFSWQPHLGLDQRLEQLSDGSVAIVESSSEATSESGEGAEASEGGSSSSAVEPTDEEGLDAEAAEQEHEKYVPPHGKHEELPSAPQLSTPEVTPKAGELEPQNTEAEYESSSSTIASAETEAEGKVLAVITPPVVMDANGNSVPASLSIEGETVTLAVAPAADAAFPVTAETADVAPGEEDSRALFRPLAATAGFHASSFVYGLSESVNAAKEDFTEEEADPNLKASGPGPLHPTVARTIIPWDMPSDGKVWKELEEWLVVVHEEGLKAYVTFGDDFGSREICSSKSQCESYQPKSDQIYAKNVERIIRAFKNGGGGRAPVSIWGAWNEPDLGYISNAKHYYAYPGGEVKAAEIWRYAKAAMIDTKCAPCTMVAGEFAEYRPGEPRYEAQYEQELRNKQTAWVKIGSARRRYPGKPGVWGLHDYHDVADYPEDHGKNPDAEGFDSTLRGSVGQTNIWISELGVELTANKGEPTDLETEKNKRGEHFTHVVKGKSEDEGKDELQAEAAKDLLDLRDLSHVEMLNYYEYRAPAPGNFDSALLPPSNAEPAREAYCVLARNEPACPPGATTEAVIQSATTEAATTAAVKVDPRGLPTRYWLEYGETAAYGHTTTPIEVANPSGEQSEAVALGGLTACTTYHYQAEAESEADEGQPALGGDRTFTTACKQLFFDGSPGTGAPPSTLGGYEMQRFPADSHALEVEESSVEGPIGPLEFDSPLEHYRVKDGWSTWSNGYTGDVYVDEHELEGGGFEITLTMPANTGAFYLYAEPDRFSNFAITATGQDGTTSGPVEVLGEYGAHYFGFYAACGAEVSTIQIVEAAGDEGLSVGEFGIAPTSGGC